MSTMDWRLKVSATLHGEQAKYELLWQPIKGRWVLSKLVPIGRHRKVGGSYERPVAVAYNPDLGPTEVVMALEWASTTVALSEGT